jgi:hypothetical protein
MKREFATTIREQMNALSKNLVSILLLGLCIYNAHGQKVKLIREFTSYLEEDDTNALQTHEYVYDRKGQLINGGQTFMDVYDEKGRVMKHTEYDVINEPEGMTVSRKKSVVHYIYDENNNVVEARETEGKLKYIEAFRYDNNNNIAMKVRSEDGKQHPDTIYYNWDIFKNLISARTMHYDDGLGNYCTEQEMKVDYAIGLQTTALNDTLLKQAFAKYNLSSINTSVLPLTVQIKKYTSRQKEPKGVMEFNITYDENGRLNNIVRTITIGKETERFETRVEYAEGNRAIVKFLTENKEGLRLPGHVHVYEGNHLIKDTWNTEEGFPFTETTYRYTYYEH